MDVLEHTGCSGACVEVLEHTWMFWSMCRCSVTRGYSRAHMDVLEHIWRCWSICECSRAYVEVLVHTWIFWSTRGCSGPCVDVLEHVWSERDLWRGEEWGLRNLPVVNTFSLTYVLSAGKDVNDSSLCLVSEWAFMQGLDYFSISCRL